MYSVHASDIHQPTNNSQQPARIAATDIPVMRLSTPRNALTTDHWQALRPLALTSCLQRHPAMRQRAMLFGCVIDAAVDAAITLVVRLIVITVEDGEVVVTL